MRCSRFATALLSAAIFVGVVGMATVGSGIEAAADFGALPNLGQAVNRFESVKDWRTFKFMEEFVNLGWKDSVLLPLPYHVAIEQALESVSISSETILNDSLTLKNIFSSDTPGLLEPRGQPYRRIGHGSSSIKRR